MSQHATLHQATAARVLTLSSLCAIVKGEMQHAKLTNEEPDMMVAGRESHTVDFHSTFKQATISL